MPRVYDITHLTDKRVYNDRPNGIASITAIVLHHDASPNAAAEPGTINWLSQYHANPVSTHKYIKRNGDIYKIVPDSKRAWHADPSRWGGVEGCNNYSIGIEIANNGLGEAYTGAQYRSLAENIAYDCSLYHIRDSDVTTHEWVREIYKVAHPYSTAGTKNDPHGLDLGLVWDMVWQVRENWPPGWPPFWHFWLGPDGRPR
jgi:N-acetyl-anhydromuramyl-L-alanine amidase AmpD